MKTICKKSIVISIILLFIVVGIHPAFAVEDKTSTSVDDNPNTTFGVILENTNCFVMGMSSNSYYSNGIKLPFIRGTIYFGFCYFFEDIQPAEGWIYTRSIVDKWIYNGCFHGKNGNVEFDMCGKGYLKIGIKDFIGLLHAESGFYLTDSFLKYIGFAKSVKIEVTDG